MKESHQTNAEIMRRNWALPLASLGVAVGGLVLAWSVHDARTILGYFAAVVGVIFAALFITRNAMPLARNAVIVATPASLTIGDEPPIDAQHVEQAKVVPQPGGHATVTLALRGGGTRVLRMWAMDAATIVDVLGVGAGARRTTFAVMTPFHWRFLGALAVVGAPWLLWLFMTAASHGRPFGTATFVGVALVCAVLAWIAGMWRGRIVVGADGFTVRSFGRERFVPFTEIETVKNAPHWMDGRKLDSVVDLRSGRTLRFSPPEAPVTNEDIGLESRALFTHLSTAFERAKKQPAHVANVAVLLASGERSGAEWLTHLDALVRGGEARYRVAAPAPEILAAITNDATSASDVRIGAAAALARRDAEGRSVVRVAADACAEPNLRATLLALSEAESDEAFADALSQSDPIAQRKR